MSRSPVDITVESDLTPADEPWRCCECGGWNYPDDGGFIRTARGPLCGICADPDHGRREAA